MFLSYLYTKFKKICGHCLVYFLLCVSRVYFSCNFKVVKSSQLPAKIAAYLVSISRLLCLAFLYGWRFLNKMSLDWPLTLTTQPSTSKLSDNPEFAYNMADLQTRNTHVMLQLPCCTVQS